MKTAPPNRRGGTAAIVAVLASLTLAACGSQLDPSEVAVSSGGTQQVGQSGEVLVPGDSAGGEELADPGVVAPDVSGDVPVGGTGGGDDSSTSASSGGGTGSSGGGDESAGGTPPSEAEDAGGSGEAASCDGFDNDQPGVTSSTITVANVSDISGPVPGIFESARQGTKAYISYFNATQKLCGHSIKLLELDSRADAGADQQAYARACAETFAAVGSMSAFDSGGAATAQKCGLPDIRSTTVNPERVKCATCFGAQSVSAGLVPDAMPDYFSGIDKAAT
jgi:hypothetical protein